MIAAGGLKVVVWHERKQAVGICVAISELDCVSVGFEALNATITCCRLWNDAKKDVISHEGVHRCSVARETVDQNSKISVGKGGMRLDQGVKLAAVGFFLQLQQDVFLVFKECVDNNLGVRSSGEATRKEGEATATNGHLTVHLNGVSIWQGLDRIHTTHSPFILNLFTVSGKLEIETLVKFKAMQMILNGLPSINRFIVNQKTIIK